MKILTSFSSTLFLKLNCLKNIKLNENKLAFIDRFLPIVSKNKVIDKFKNFTDKQLEVILVSIGEVKDYDLH